jgi:hypothetical protein
VVYSDKIGFLCGLLRLPRTVLARYDINGVKEILPIWMGLFNGEIS